jgi:hypothetical protein
MSVALKEASKKKDLIRPDRNLEKWPIWRPSRSRAKLRARSFERESTLPDGNKVVSKVEIGFSQKGVLNTFDQKVFYALIKIWENKGRPTEQVVFSLREISKILKKKWGTKNINYIKDSLLRLRINSFIWRDSYYSASTKETVRILNPYTILNELKVIERETHGVVGKASGYFLFNDNILKNLLANHTRPVCFDVVLGFRSEIAQLCYTHFSLMLAQRNHYQRRSKKLFFDDLVLEGRRYLHTYIRKYELKKAIKEINGKSLPTGIIEVEIKKTKDRNDVKVVCRKIKTKSVSSECEINEVQVIELPKADPKSKELVLHFHEKLGRVQYEPTRKEIYQATVFIARRGYTKSKFIVEYAIKEAEKTNYKMRTFGAIFQYENEAVKSYEKIQKQKDLAEIRKANQEKLENERRVAELKEKKELDQIYNSLNKSQKTEIDTKIKEMFKRSPFRLKDPESPVYKSVMENTKYKVLREFKKL